MDEETKWLGEAAKIAVHYLSKCAAPHSRYTLCSLTRYDAFMTNQRNTFFFILRPNSWRIAWVLRLYACALF